MRKKIFVSLTMLFLAAALVGGATFAYFSDAGTSTGNTFTAGTLDMTMDGLDDTSATWVSPTNWAPGQSETATIDFTNIGSIDAKHIYFGFKDLTTTDPGSDGSNLMEQIIVTEIVETFNGVPTANQAASVASQIGNNDNVLTLREFAGFMTGGYGYYTWDNLSTDGTILAANDGDDYGLTFTFKFDQNAENQYQGDSAGFTLMAKATQNSPTEGLVCLHAAE